MLKNEIKFISYISYNYKAFIKKNKDEFYF